MRIVDRVEINYFRSVYSVSLTQCRDINVLVGSNDAGKSNILRAMNLFFTNEPEPHVGFDFLKDLSRGREEEARAAKGRMSIWIKIHFNNFLKWKSLPDQFWVKRSWNRYDDRPADSFTEDLVPTTLYRFLNKIQFHYVPAIRSRSIFSDLLADLHDTLLQDESLGLKGSSQDLVDDLHTITEGMSEQIKARLGIDSTIEIPENLKDLFRALNFSTKYGDFQIPLNLRGDGIQSRHLPFILDYIASKSNRYHIWAYEEPENSLELSRSFEMARDFTEIFSKENQIFLTTHSPAFYDISRTKASKWYVENSAQVDGESTYTTVSQINTVQDIDKSMGLLTVIAPRMRKANEELEELREDLARMGHLLAETTRPAVYVEGDTDVEILLRAARVHGMQEGDVSFVSSEGASNITQFLKVMSRTKSDQRVLIGLYDGDTTGRTEFDRFQSSHVLSGTGLRVVSRPSRIYVGALQPPQHLQAVSRQFAEMGVQLPLCIEYMFDPALIARAQALGVLALQPRRSRLSISELPLEVKVEDVLRGRIDDQHLYFARKVADHSKRRFATWLAEQDDVHFEPFSQVIADIRTALQ